MQLCARLREAEAAADGAAHVAHALADTDRRLRALAARKARLIAAQRRRPARPARLPVHAALAAFCRRHVVLARRREKVALDAAAKEAKLLRKALGTAAGVWARARADAARRVAGAQRRLGRLLSAHGKASVARGVKAWRRQQQRGET